MSKIPPHIFLNDPYAPAVCHRCEQVLQHATSLKNHVNTMSCKTAAERLRKGDVRCPGCNKIFCRDSYDNHIRTMRCHQNSELLKKHRKHEEYIKNNVFNPAINKDLSRENAWLEYVAKVQRGEISDETTPPPVKKRRLASISSNYVRPGNATQFRVRKSPPNGGLPSCFIKPKNWNRPAAAAREQEANRAREQERNRARKLEAKRARERLEDKRASEILEEQRANFASDNNIKRMLGLEIRPRRKAVPAAASASNAATAAAAVARGQSKTVVKQQNETNQGPESRRLNYRPVNPGNVTSGTATKPKPKTVFMECMEIIEKQAVARSSNQLRW